MKFKIYICTCLINGKVYVGQTCARLAKRIWTHFNGKYQSGSFQRALRKHGASSFDWQVVVEVSSKEESDSMERAWILALRSHIPEFGYNLTLGGDGTVGHVPTEETRRKRSASLKAAYACGRRVIIPNFRHTTPHTEETKLKMSEASRARKRPPKKSCSVIGCDKPNHAKGYCSNHHHRFSRYGDPLAGGPFRHRNIRIGV